MNGSAIVCILVSFMQNLMISVPTEKGEPMLNDKDRAFWLKEPDLVKVVRCGKCKWYDPDSGYCQFWHGVRHPGHFCGEGVKKGNETDKS